VSQHNKKKDEPMDLPTTEAGEEAKAFAKAKMAQALDGLNLIARPIKQAKSRIVRKDN
jgi:hypothetical protein